MQTVAVESCCNAHGERAPRGDGHNMPDRGMRFIFGVGVCRLAGTVLDLF